MSMEAVGVNYEILLAKLKELRSQCVEIEKNVKLLIEYTQKIDIFWDGDANEVFVTGINEDIAIAETTVLGIRNRLNELTDIIISYQSTESVIRQIVGGIKL